MIKQNMDKRNYAFDRTNFTLLAIGFAIVVIGFILMSGSILRNRLLIPTSSVSAVSR